MTKKAGKKLVEHLKGLILKAFDLACAKTDIEPIFREAAGGEESGGGLSYHSWDKGILPGVREAIYTDNKQNVMLRHMRANSAEFTQMHLSKG